MICWYGNVYSVDRDLFENLSDDGETYYATSSEINESTAAVVDIGGRYDSVYKSDPFCRVRLCRYLSEDENMIVISEDADNVDIFYTTDGSTPDKTSILYLKPFIADEGTTIKAIAFNDGMMPSDVAEYATGYLYDNLTHWQLSNGQKINEAGHTLVWVFDDSTHKHEECNICDYKTDPIYVPPIL